MSISVDGPRAALVDTIIRALRSEAGVRYNQRENKPTGYYAGRRTGFVVSAAILAHYVYGVDMDEAKEFLAKAIRESSKEDLEAPDKDERAMVIAVTLLTL
jgi:hypothetical protein